MAAVTYTPQGDRARALFRNIIHDPHLITCSPCNEASGGTVYGRSTKNRYHGTVNGNPTYGTSLAGGFLGLTLDGTDDFIDYGLVTAVPNLNFERTSTFSFLAVIDPTNLGAGDRAVYSQWLASGGGGNGRGVLIGFSTATFTCILRSTLTTSEIIKTIDTAFTADADVMVAVTYDGGSLAAGLIPYKNGVAVAATAAVDNLTTTIQDASQRVRLGAVNDDTLDFTGDIGFHAWFNAAKTAEEIRRWAYIGGYL